MKLKKYLVSLVIFMISGHLFAQLKDNCKFLEQSLNLPNVVSKFGMDKVMADSIILIDDGHFFKGCGEMFWGINRLWIRYDKNISTELRKYQMYYVLGKKENYYLINRIKKDKKSYTISLYRPFSGLHVELRVKKIKSRYEFESMEVYVM